MKTALITGGTKGIGKAIAFEFLKRGYEVVINYSSDEGAAIATQAEFNMLGYCPVLMRADVSDEAQVEDMFSEIFRLYDRLDVLVNNAGITRDGLLARMKDEDFDAVIDVNLKFCSLYDVEGYTVERELQKAGIPVLGIETDYVDSDAQQLRTRISAFIEMLGA